MAYDAHRGFRRLPLKNWFRHSDHLDDRDPSLTLGTKNQRIPTCPFTDPSNFFESQPTPSLKTSSTFSPEIREQAA